MVAREAAAAEAARAAAERDAALATRQVICYPTCWRSLASQYTLKEPAGIQLLTCLMVSILLCTWMCRHLV